jgi:hypothetical protein
MSTTDMSNRATLDRFHQVWQALRPTSSDEEFAQFGAFFDESCTAWLQSMREWEEPSIGRQATVAQAKELAAIYHVERRTVTSSLTSDDGRTVMLEMRNRLDVLGVALDPFYETAVARFNDDGLIVDLKMYSCRSPIVGIVQTVTGKGPYTAEVMKDEFE